jgi:hypothetical protein
MKVYYECDNDEALLNHLLTPKAIKEHSHSKGNVCNSVAKNNNVIGLVDEDSGTQQQRYITRLGNPVSMQNGIRIYVDKARCNRIVMICPRLEEWLYNVAKRNNIDPTSFRLDKDPDKLHKEELRKTKTKFNNFLKALEDTNELKFLKSQLV